MPLSLPPDFDVGIVGAGPAGLSAAILLGRCCRRVLVWDHGQPRNAAAVAIHGFLGREDIAPAELRWLGRTQAAAYGVKFWDQPVSSADRIGDDQPAPTRFLIACGAAEPTTVRKLLIATGLRDHKFGVDIGEVQSGDARRLSLAAVDAGLARAGAPLFVDAGVQESALVALADGQPVVGLAVALRTWSDQVTACSNGSSLSSADRARLHDNGIVYRCEQATAALGAEGQIASLVLRDGPRIECEALFFSGATVQRSNLATSLGCADAGSQIPKVGRQGTGIPGLFVAGDADDDTQFAIVAAAEGAKAAREPVEREIGGKDAPGPRLAGLVPCQRRRYPRPRRAKAEGRRDRPHFMVGGRLTGQGRRPYPFPSAGRAARRDCRSRTSRPSAR